MHNILIKAAKSSYKSVDRKQFADQNPIDEKTLSGVIKDSRVAGSFSVSLTSKFFKKAVYPKFSLR